MGVFALPKIQYVLYRKEGMPKFFPRLLWGEKNHFLNAFFSLRTHMRIIDQTHGIPMGTLAGKSFSIGHNMIGRGYFWTAMHLYIAFFFHFSLCGLGFFFIGLCFFP